MRLEQRNDNIHSGRETCEREFKRYNLNFTKLHKSGKIGQVAEEFGVHSVQELLASVGFGKISVSQIVQKLVPPEKLESKLRLLQKKQKTEKKPKSKTYPSGIKVKGLDHILVNFAKCCNPLPGDKIVGYITKGRGVTVHAGGCPRLSDTDKEKHVEVSWNLDQELTRPVKVKVLCHDKPGLLSELAGAIARLKSNIKGAQVATTKDNRAVSIFEVEVKNFSHLEDIIRTIRKIKGVIEVHRVRM
jgi:GTP pyrophosphokinase